MIEASPWVIDLLAVLRPMLKSWPPVLPAKVGDPVRPLAIGIDKDLRALMGPPPSDAHAIMARRLRRYAGSIQYKMAIAEPGSHRHAIDGTPVEPVAEEHRRLVPRAIAARVAKKEIFQVVAKVRSVKVAAALDPGSLRPAPAGAAVTLTVGTEFGLRASAQINPKSYRRAVETVKRLGAANVAVVLQGRMVTPGQILDAGISIQEKAR